MKKLRSKEGFTLVEVIVTILLIAVVSTILLYLFTDSFKNIVHSGQKDEAISRNSNILDVIYSIEKTESISDITNSVNINDLNYVGCSNLKDSTNSNISRYCIKEVSDDGKVIGYQVQVITFYLNGERSVIHTSFVRKKG